jgi:hypothetical protein
VLILAQEDTMRNNERQKPRSRTCPAEKSLDEPENLSPIPGAAPPEEPQVDEVLPPDEKREYRRAQRARSQDSI